MFISLQKAKGRNAEKMSQPLYSLIIKFRRLSLAENQAENICPKIKVGEVDEALLLDDPVKYWRDRSRKAMLSRGMRVARLSSAPSPPPPGVVSQRKVERLLGVNIICDTCRNRMHHETRIQAIQNHYSQDSPVDEKIYCYLTCNRCAADIVLARDADNNSIVHGATLFSDIRIEQPYSSEWRRYSRQWRRQSLQHGFPSSSSSSVTTDIPGEANVAGALNARNRGFPSSSSSVTEDVPGEADVAGAATAHRPRGRYII